MVAKTRSVSLQRGVRSRFKRNKVITLGIDDQWEMDLMDMSKFSKENSGYSFILVVIDIFSKFSWMKPLKDKKDQSVTAAFHDIVSKRVDIQQGSFRINIRSSDFRSSMPF